MSELLGAAREADPQQAAGAALMIRPAAFGWNAETRDSNRFQARIEPDDPALSEKARAEFDATVDTLRGAGVPILVCDDRPQPRCPDAVFPNNWVSFHHDGTIVLYPMLAPTRRRERRPELLLDVVQQGGFGVTRLLDLTHNELHGRFLEGTGSIVFDHVARIAYACLSPRTHVEVLEELAGELGYATCTFAARGRDGTAIYHTNVMLAIGSRFALIGSEAVAASDRARLLRCLETAGRAVLEVEFDALEAFAGNVLELRAADGAGVLVLSARARAGLGAQRFDALADCVQRVVVASVESIERAGGGSVRCMLAEVFLPPRRGGR